MKIVTQEDKNKIKQLKEQKMTYVEIGRILGIHETTVSYWANDEKREQTKTKARQSMNIAVYKI